MHVKIWLTVFIVSSYLSVLKSEHRVEQWEMKGRGWKRGWKKRVEKQRDRKVERGRGEKTPTIPSEQALGNSGEEKLLLNRKKNSNRTKLRKGQSTAWTSWGVRVKKERKEKGWRGRGGQREVIGEKGREGRGEVEEEAGGFLFLKKWKRFFFFLRHCSWSSFIWRMRFFMSSIVSAFCFSSFLSLFSSS